MKQNRQDCLSHGQTTLNTEAHAEAPLKSTEATCGHSPMTLKVFTLIITGVKATQRACIFHRWASSSTKQNVNVWQWHLPRVAVQIPLNSPCSAITAPTHCSSTINMDSYNSGFLSQSLIISTKLSTFKQTGLVHFRTQYYFCFI